MAGGKPIQTSAIVLYKFLFEVSKKEHKTKTTVRPDFERPKLAFFIFGQTQLKIKSSYGVRCGTKGVLFHEKLRSPGRRVPPKSWPSIWPLFYKKNFHYVSECIFKYSTVTVIPKLTPKSKARLCRVLIKKPKIRFFASQTAQFDIRIRAINPRVNIMLWLEPLFCFCTKASLSLITVKDVGKINLFAAKIVRSTW